MRKRGRVDANQEAIVAALRRSGCSVEVLSAHGGGLPDLLVGFRGRNVLLEIKSGVAPPSARKLTPAQVAWHQAWRGSVQIVTTPIEALEAVLGVRGPLADIADLISKIEIVPDRRLHVGPPGSKIK